MTKFIIINLNGKAVQLWTFAHTPKAHIIYCTSPEWAMKFDNEKSANRQCESLKKHFPGQALKVMKITIETKISF